MKMESTNVTVIVLRAWIKILQGEIFSLILPLKKNLYQALSSWIIKLVFYYLKRSVI